MNKFHNNTKKTKLKKQSKQEKEVENLLENPYKYAKKISILKLEKLLRRLSTAYYNTGESLVPDAVYDLMRDVLEERDSNNNLLGEVGAPILKDKVKLPYPMASLDKIKPSTDALGKWLEKYKGPYTLSDKLDGVSALLTHKNNKLKLYTRGNGEYGQDISSLISYVLPHDFKKKNLPNGIAVRGELIISKKNFERVRGTHKIGRTTVAGLVNSKTLSKREHVAEVTEFVAYSIVNPGYKKDEQMKMMKKLGFTTVSNRMEKNISNEELSSYLINRRKNAKYEVDGIVVNDASKKYTVKNKNPKHGFAFKAVLTDQIAETKVLEIIWNVSMNGYLKPKVRVEQVNIGGTTVKFATAHNARFIVDNKLGPGAIIKLVRSGDVIPYISKIIIPATKPQLPDVPYKWNKSNVDFVVKDMHGDQSDNIIMRQAEHFFKKLGIKYISSGIIKKIVDSGYNKITDILDLLLYKLEDAAEIEGIGKTLLTKVKDNIETAFKTTNLAIFMAASHKFGRGFGERKVKPILEKYPTLLSKDWSIKKMTKKLLDIDGFSDTTAEQFANNFSKFKKFFGQVNKIINIKHLKKHKKKKSNKTLFKDKKMVLTGFRDKEIEKFIEENGGKVSSSVSSNTDIVVFYQKPNTVPSSKLKKAIELKIETINKDDFMTKYNL